MEMPLTVRNVVCVNGAFTHVSVYMFEVFAGVKGSEKGTIQDSQVSNATVARLP